VATLWVLKDNKSSFGTDMQGMYDLFLAKDASQMKLTLNRNAQRRFIGFGRKDQL